MHVLSSITSNPLFVQQIRKSKVLTAKLAAQASVRLTMIITFVAIIASIIREEAKPLQILLLFFALAFVAAIPFVAYATAISTVREVKDEGYELLLLTTLSNARIAIGLLLRAYYRIRVLLLFLLTATPVLIVGMTYLDRQSYVQYCTLKLSSCIFLSEATVFSLLTFIFIMICTWGFVLLSSIIGLTLGLWWRNIYLSGLGAVFICFAMVLTLVIAMISMPSDSVLRFQLASMMRAQSMPLQAIGAAVPYVIASLIIHFSQVFVRKS